MVTWYNFVNVTLNPDIRIDYKMLLFAVFAITTKQRQRIKRINAPSLLKNEIVWLFLLRDTCEMFRHFVSTLLYYNNKISSSGLLRLPTLLLAITLYYCSHFPYSEYIFQIWTTLAGYKELAVRSAPIEKGRIF